MAHSVKDINQLLPQTQCTRCGYDGCLPYAQAIAQGQAHNQCPPGGQDLIDELSELLQRPTLSLNPIHGQETAPKLAIINEDQCIGCTKCIQACPVDAIFGTSKSMHTVIQSECNGCELCVEPCPVDCIDIVIQDQPIQTRHERKQKSIQYLQRIDSKQQRTQRRKNEKLEAHRQAKAPTTNTTASAKQSKLDYIQAALMRSQNKRTSS